MDKLKAWLQTTPYANFTLSPASADASFRKYYRLMQGRESYVLMDSSLEIASLQPFVDVSKRLQKIGVHAPALYLKEETLGYLVLEDFGDTTLLEILNEDNFKEHYSSAIDSIIAMQEADTEALPLYDAEFLLGEMQLMQEWYLQKNLALSLNSAEKGMLQTTLEQISKKILSQPQNIFVHRDFHSRNIMLTPLGEYGIIDYQDAMSGALTYDLVSLLKDCYIAFSRKEIEELALSFRDKKKLAVSDAEFLSWFDFMGMQRHIKVLGIFSRLFLRDKKENYLQDIPLVLHYLIETASRYDATQELALFLKRVTQ